MCENVKTYHSETGFIGGMVVLNSGQISNEGSNVEKHLRVLLKIEKLLLLHIGNHTMIMKILIKVIAFNHYFKK